VQAASGENVPVQVIWSREEDIRGGHYRPQFIHRLKGVLDNQGYPLAWHQRVVGKSIMQNTKHDPAYMVRGMDIYSLDGCLQEPFGVFPYGTSYEIPNHRIESHNPAKTGVRPHEWRAVGHTHTGIAQSVELTVDEDGSYSVDKVFCVVDCGFAVNPLGIQGQIEGGIMLGLNAVAYGAIDVVDGRVVQSNFHDYRPLRMHQMPEVEIHIMPSELPPTGVGEQSTTPIAPAIGNAIFNATGKRVRDFPLDRQGFVLKG
jgi:isoquinoline 1-oxidoreductase beta subunit